MLEMIYGLEPIRFEKDDIIMEELEEVYKCVFTKSDIQIGYSINGQYIFRLNVKDAEVGAYGITFNKRAHYIYKVNQDSNCQFIRKINWMKAMNNPAYKEVSNLIK